MKLCVLFATFCNFSHFAIFFFENQFLHRQQLLTTSQIFTTFNFLFLFWGEWGWRGEVSHICNFLHLSQYFAVSRKFVQLFAIICNFVLCCNCSEFVLQLRKLYALLIVRIFATQATFCNFATIIIFGIFATFCKFRNLSQHFTGVNIFLEIFVYSNFCPNVTTTMNVYWITLSGI